MVGVPFTKRMHKESIGILLVSVDIISILVLAKFFSKLDNINREFTTKIDNITV